MKLKVEELTFSYENRKVLDSIGFAVDEGEFVSLLGPSGSGKSTILKLLTGVLTPFGGSIAVDDRNPVRRNWQAMTLWAWSVLLLITDL